MGEKSTESGCHERDISLHFATHLKGLHCRLLIRVFFALYFAKCFSPHFCFVNKYSVMLKLLHTHKQVSSHKRPNIGGKRISISSNIKQTCSIQLYIAGHLFIDIYQIENSLQCKSYKNIQHQIGRFIFDTCILIAQIIKNKTKTQNRANLIFYAMGVNTCM